MNDNTDDVIGIDDAVCILKLSSFTDEVILADFSSDQEALKEGKDLDAV